MNDVQVKKIIDFIEELKAKRLGLLASVDAEVNRTLEQKLSSFGQLKVKANSFIETFKAIEQQADGLLNDVSQFTGWCEQLDVFSAQLSEQAAEIDVMSTVIADTAGDLREEVNSALDFSKDAISETVDECFETVDLFAISRVETVAKQTEGLIDDIVENRDRSIEHARNLCAELIPDHVAEKANAFLGQVDELQGSGVNQLGKMTKQVRELTDKTRAITELIKKVEPVLDQLRSLP